MTDSTQDNSTPRESSPSNVSGGVNLDANHVDIGGDVVGRDKITHTEQIDTGGGAYLGGSVEVKDHSTFAGRDFIHVEPGATLIISGPPDAKKDLAPSVSERQQFEPETLLISAGPFLMGSQPGPGIEPSETPQHEVTLPVYYIGKYPITNREYAEFISREKGQDAPKTHWSGRKPLPDKLDHPVVDVSWNDALAYCKWLSQQTGRTYHLPTEAEWEKAACGTDGRVYPWGNDWRDNVCNASGGNTMPVTAHPNGASPFGCEDMLGNIEEWTSTLWGTGDPKIYAYPYQANDGREDMDDKRLFRPRRVHRGGSFRDEPGSLHCSARGSSNPTSTAKWRGFRVALEP